MDRVEAAAGVLAVLRAPARRDFPTVERVATLMHDGLDAALDRAYRDLFGSTEALDVARGDVREWMRHMQVSSILDDTYPHVLSTSYLAPGLVFTHGELIAPDMGVSIVGSRAATIAEERIAASIARRMCEMGLSVVSGLAKGIDAAAHRAALEVGGRTVAVVGTPLERTYPAEHEGLRNEIVASGGLILSQFAPGTRTGRHSFPMRNVTMSGYSIATVIVTAHENSGTKHQANGSLDHGRSVILLPEVVSRTTWGKDLATRVGVHVAHDLDELTRVIDAVREEWDWLPQAAQAG